MVGAVPLSAVLACHISGARFSLPALYRQRAVSYTDFWETYEAPFPGSGHRRVGKETGQTSRIERFKLYTQTTCFAFSQKRALFVQEIGKP